MGKFYDEISPDQQEWIKKQKMFVVASAPLSPTGTINASPKGYDCFRIIDANTACYLEMSGSGIETQSHVEENGRLTIMFMAFEESSKILRLLGNGHVCRVDTPEYESLYNAHFRGTCPDLEAVEGKRSIIVINVKKVSISCGFGVPYYDYKGDRPTMLSYWAKKNTQSLDGLPEMKHEGMKEFQCEYQASPPVMASEENGSMLSSWYPSKHSRREFGQLLTLGAVAVAAFGAGVITSAKVPGWR
ncbi:hypothetical protein FBU30_007662 [Linnemannia zychae]|nr:hypothetical protein FBU30_007662 [Linnemannia zychae]